MFQPETKKNDACTPLFLDKLQLSCASSCFLMWFLGTAPTI